MKKIKVEDIKDIESYNKERAQARQYILKIKAPRRIILGPYLNFLFENRDTMLYQIQEMILVENITTKEGIQHEVDTYNNMIPDFYELKATLLIEFNDPEIRKVKLAELLGLEKEIQLLINKKHKIPASYDRRQIAKDKLSSVQFLSFEMGEEITQEFLKTDKIEIMTSHPACSYRTLLSQEQQSALKSDVRNTEQGGALKV